MKATFILPVIAMLIASCKKAETVTRETTVSAAEAATDAKSYPLKVCIVSGEELGTMGDPVSIVQEGQTIKFCCDSCVPKFKKDPDKYLEKLKTK
jgi:YHS domain-containing protein